VGCLSAPPGPPAPAAPPPPARARGGRDLADVLVRRLALFRDAADQGLAAAAPAAALVGDELGWDDRRRARAVADYRESVRLSRRWRSEL
jgi:glycerol-3-phosphate dehydrogenase